MMIQTFWLLALILVLIWYVVVTIIVAARGFGSLKIMLKDLDEE